MADEAFFQAVEIVGEPMGVQTEQVEHRGVEVVDAHAVFDGFVSNVVGGAVDVPAFDAAASSLQFGWTTSTVISH